MYTLITGAVKDAGDFIILERGKALLKTYKGKELWQLNKWDPLDDKLDQVNATEAIILCGGPGYSANFYPGVFPLAKNIDDIKVPIIPMALGWDGDLMFYPEKFSFNKSSMSLLGHIHRNVRASSCRDNITKEILNRHGFQNVMMTGCNAWYDLVSIGKKFERPKEIHRVAITTPNNPIFFKQTVELLQEVKKIVTRLYPKVELYAVFHRGIEHDEYTPRKEAKLLLELKERAGELGYITVDASYDISKIEFYRECDFHVGYRVHAHAFFLSIRKPTFLLWEDGRGRGLSESLGLPDVPAVSKSSLTSQLYNIEQYDLLSYSNSVLDKLRIRKPVALLGRPVYRGAAVIWKSAVNQTTPLNQAAVATVVKDVEAELTSGFQRFRKLDTVLDNHFKEMVKFLKGLP